MFSSQLPIPRHKYNIISIFILISLVIGICLGYTPTSDSDDQPTVILISMDGFRWDYLQKTDTPNFDALIREGVKARSLIPIFPSKTFPNHYTIVTGLYAENHGIVANRMYDPEFDAYFWIGEGSASVRESRWWGGEPIWVTAEKQGRITAAMFWPGSETKIEGIQPTYWFVYDGSLSNEKRIDQVFSWLDFPTEKRPSFITLYFSDTDDTGHEYGPNSPEIAMSIKQLDEILGKLIDGLKSRGLLQEINLILVSDHGMTQLSRSQVIFLDDYIDMSTVNVVDWLPVAIWTSTKHVNEIYHALIHANPHLVVYKKDEIPLRYHYRNHRRIPPLLAVPDEGWSVTTHSKYNSHPDYYTGGTHGYDPIYPSMHGIFIAHGPAFKKGVSVHSIKNIHLYDLIAAILQLDPAPNDGSLDSVKVFLK